MNQPDKFAMRNWKSTLGGACGALGKALTGIVGAHVIISVKSPTPVPLPDFVIIIWVVGFLVDCAGTFFAHFFAADKTEVRRLLQENEDHADGRYMTKLAAEKRLDEKEDK